MECAQTLARAVFLPLSKERGWNVAGLDFTGGEGIDFSLSLRERVGVRV